MDILKTRGAFFGNDIINRSRAGETSFDGIWTFHEDIAPFSPDILMLHFGIDDAYFPVYRSEFKENLVQMVRLAKNFTGRIILLTSHDFDNQYDRDSMNIYYRTIREVSVDLACGMIPVHTYWRGYCEERGLDNSGFVQRDERYPTEKGHEIYAEAVENNFERITGSMS